MLRKVLFAIAILVVFVVIFDAVFHHKQQKMDTVLGGKTFTMEISDTDVLREVGLSGRKSLDDVSGMIFIFDKPDKYGFWMKDMNFPLDIVWVSEDYRIVHIEKSLGSETYPKIYYPETPAKYVLEISAGQIEKLNVKIGDTVQI